MIIESKSIDAKLFSPDFLYYCLGRIFLMLIVLVYNDETLVWKVYEG